MKKKRIPKKASKPPPRGSASRARVPPAPRSLQYKVVELSQVDEQSIETTVNALCAKGWSLDSMQFAMRESSRRPSMAFIFFSREGEPLPLRSESEAQRHLHRLAGEEGAAAVQSAVSPYERLRQLAGEDDT